MSKEDRERLADLQYEAWRRGKNPDAISEDRYDTYRSRGLYPDEIGLGMLLPKPYPPEEEEEVTP